MSNPAESTPTEVLHALASGGATEAERMLAREVLYWRSHPEKGDLIQAVRTALRERTAALIDRSSALDAKLEAERTRDAWMRFALAAARLIVDRGDPRHRFEALQAARDTGDPRAEEALNHLIPIAADLRARGR